MIIETHYLRLGNFEAHWELRAATPRVYFQRCPTATHRNVAIGLPGVHLDVSVKRA